MIIGLAGYARSGKDTVAGLMTDYQRRAFADPIRETLMALDPLIGSNLHLSAAVKREGWEEAKNIYPEVRRLLQNMGTEVGRQIIDPDLWVKISMRDLRITDQVVFTDVRFKNEAEAIKMMGGNVWRINRPGVEALNSHSSENSMDGWNYDLILTNHGSIKDLRSQLPLTA